MSIASSLLADATESILANIVHIHLTLILGINMKKNDLIKMLQELPGNPDILLWNGFAQDWMDIEKELVPHILVKQSEQDYSKHCAFEIKRDKNDFNYELTDAEKLDTKKWYRNVSWEFNSFVTKEDITTKRYKQKNIFFLNAKTRGINTFDRVGDITY